MPPEYQAMLKSFSSTVKGKIIKVDYFIKVLVKYDSWNDYSEGKSKMIPIEILQPPTQLVAIMPPLMVRNWNPIV